MEWRGVWSGLDPSRPKELVDTKAVTMNSQYIKSVARPFRRLAPLAGVTLLFAGCEALTLDREPEVAHVELDSPDVSRLTLVTSQWFIDIEDPECEIPGDPGCPRRIQLVEADTSTVSLPFMESYPFTFRLQFYAEAFTNPPVEATVAMKVHLDDEEWYNDSRLLVTMDSDGEQEKMTFQYQYHQPRF